MYPISFFSRQDRELSVPQYASSLRVLDLLTRKVTCSVDMAFVSLPLQDVELSQELWTLSQRLTSFNRINNLNIESGIYDIP